MKKLQIFFVKIKNSFSAEKIKTGFLWKNRKGFSLKIFSFAKIEKFVPLKIMKHYFLFYLWKIGNFFYNNYKTVSFEKI